MFVSFCSTFVLENPPVHRQVTCTGPWLQLQQIRIGQVQWHFSNCRQARAYFEDFDIVWILWRLKLDWKASKIGDNEHRKRTQPHLLVPDFLQSVWGTKLVILWSYRECVLGQDIRNQDLSQVIFLQYSLLRMEYSFLVSPHHPSIVPFCVLWALGD